ncbi:MAG: hypothetical protein R3B06_11950 [Kofleriaceae bacterium]
MARTIDPKVSGEVFDPGAPRPWRDDGSPVPLVLLPVRVETRWFATTVAQELELRVRIFPDAVHVANVAAVTDDEREAMIAYWRTRVADGEAAAGDRWTALCGALGTARAAWLRERLWPTTGPGGEPAFPAPDATPAPTAIARGLPNRFAVALCADAAVVGSRWGAVVPEEIAVLEPTDFATAEAIGLAMRLVIDRAVASQLTHVVVFGLRGDDPGAEQAVVQALLRDHAIDRGVTLLPAGSQLQAGGAARPSVEPDAVLAERSDGGRVAAALGLPRHAMTLVAGASHDTDAVPRAMAQAMWPTTWGYFLESIVGSPITAAMRDAGRALFVDHVRPLGPLPALAIGRQPYGLLPTTAVTRWRKADGTPAPLVEALTTLLPAWQRAGGAAPRLPATGDALPALQAILSRHDQSARYQLRRALTFDVAAAALFGEDLDDARRRALQAILAGPLAAQLVALGVAVPDPTAITPLIHGESAHELTMPLVAADDQAGAPPYLAALAALTDPWAFRAHGIAGATPRTVLYSLLRHATLLVLGRTSDRLAGLATTDWREPDVQVAKTESVWDRMDQPLASHGGQSPRALFQQDLPGDQYAALRAHRDALRVLVAGSRADLERATRATIDATSHRLDAWITAHATERLGAMRAAKPEGVLLGAYAWLTAPPVPLAPVVEGTVADRGSRGFMLAPSLDHARTAAVLRAAFEARPTSDLAVDLSSRRVARSQDLFDGLRAGHGLAELLGYEIERRVANAALIQTLRQQFPLSTAGDPDPNRARLDGLAAHLAWRATPPTGALAPVALAVADLIDGAADVLLAETIHQHVRGNPERAGATLEAIAAGTVAPPRCAVVETPSKGDLTRTQVLWAFDQAPAGWPGDASRVRAVANPVLNGALVALVAPPQALGVTIAYGVDGVTTSLARTVLDLDLCALDLCALGGDDFASSPLAAAFAALAPAATTPQVTPSTALAAAVVTARGFREALAQAIPLGGQPATGAPSGAAVAATALIEALIADPDDVSTRRLNGWLGGASADGAAVRALAASRLAAATAGDAPLGQALSGLPEPRTSTVAFTASTQLTKPAQHIAWLADAARVRAPLAGLELITMTASVPVTSGTDPEGGLALIVGAPLTATSPVLRLDAWTEGRPRASRDAAVAIHHDAPRARAPQAILLAVPPVLGAAWSPASVLDVVLETFDLVAARRARPAEVWGPSLPALYLSERQDDTTVSTPMTDVAVNLEIRG